MYNNNGRQKPDYLKSTKANDLRTQQNYYKKNSLNNINKLYNFSTISTDKLQSYLDQQQVHQNIKQMVTSLQPKYCTVYDKNKYSSITIALLEQAIMEEDGLLLEKILKFSRQNTFKLSYYLQRINPQENVKYIAIAEGNFETLLLQIKRDMDQTNDKFAIYEKYVSLIKENRPLRTGSDYFLRGILLSHFFHNNTQKVQLKNLTLDTFQHTNSQFYDCISEKFERKITILFSNPSNSAQKIFMKEYPLSSNNFSIKYYNTIYFLELNKINGNPEYISLFSPLKQTKHQRQISEQMRQNITNNIKNLVKDQPSNSPTKPYNYQSRYQNNGSNNQSYTNNSNNNNYNNHKSYNNASNTNDRNNGYLKNNYLQEDVRSSQHQNRNQQQKSYQPEMSPYDKYLYQKEQEEKLMQQKYEEYQQKQQQQKDPSQRQCEICLQIKDKKQGYTNPRCKHFYCQKCLIKEQQNEEMQNLCFNKYCKKVIDMEELEDFFIRQSMMISEEENQTWTNKFECSHCKSVNELTLTKNQKAEFFKCQKCSKTNCLEHKQLLEKCFCFCSNCLSDNVKTQNQRKFCEKCKIILCQKCNTFESHAHNIQMFQQSLAQNCLKCLKLSQNSQFLSEIAPESCSICLSFGLEKLEKTNCGHLICKSCKFQQSANQFFKQHKNSTVLFNNKLTNCQYCMV